MLSHAKEIFTSSNGLLLHIYISNSVIQLDQFKYNPESTKFDELKNSESFSIVNKNVEFSFDEKQATVNCGENLILFIRSTSNEQHPIRVLVIVFDKSSESYKFDSALSSSLSNLLQITLADIDFNRVYIKIDRRRFVFVRVNFSQTECELQMIKQLRNGKEERAQIRKVISKESIESGQVVEWSILNDFDFEDLASLKLLAFAKIKYLNNSVTLKTIFIDQANNSLTECNSEQIFGLFSQPNSNTCKLLTNANQNQRNFLSINENFLNLVDSFIQPTSITGMDLTHMNVIELNVTNENRNSQNQLSISGECVLVLNNNQNSFLVHLNNGCLKSKLKLEHSYDSFKVYKLDDININNHIDFDMANSPFELFLVAKVEKSTEHHIYQIKTNSVEIVGQVNNLSAIIADLFNLSCANETEKEEYSFQFLFIYNWSDKNFELRKSLVRNDNRNNNRASFEIRNDNFNNSFELDYEQENQASKSIINPGNDLLTGNKSETYNSAHELTKLFENKSRICDCLLNDANMEAKRKYALITDLTRSSISNLENDALPKLVEVYSSGVSIINAITNSRKTSKQRIQMNSSWSCFFNQKLLLNFAFVNETGDTVTDMNCVMLVKNGFGLFLNLKYVQNVFKMEKSEFEQLQAEIEFQDLDKFKNISQIFEPNSFIILSLELEVNSNSELISTFPGGYLNFNLLLNYCKNTNYESQTFPVFMNVYDYLTDSKELPSFKTRMSILHHFQSSASSMVKFKYSNISEPVLNKILTGALHFKRFGSIFMMNKQSIFADCVCVLSGQVEQINSGHITIFCLDFNQLSGFLFVLNKCLRAELSSSLFNLEIDMDSTVDKILDALIKESELIDDFVQDNGNLMTRANFEQVISSEIETDKIISEFMN